MALVATPLALTAPASANPAGTGLVISEVYGAGGNTGAAWKTDYVELYNPTGASIDVSNMSVQYRSKTGISDPTGVITLKGSVPAGGYYLVGGASGANGAALPQKPNASNTGVNLSGTDGTVFLANQKAALTAPATGATGASAANPAIVDLVGFGASNTWEGPTGSTAGAPAPSTTKSIERTGNDDTDVSSADFAVTTSSTGGTPQGQPVPPPPAPVTKTIEEIQGDGFSSPLEGQNVTTRGVVTAAYPTGGLHGMYIQTAGTGGALDLDTHTTSDAVFVDLGENVTQGEVPATGTLVEVTGVVTENFGLTTLVTDDPSAVTKPSDTFVAPQASSVVWPSSSAKRESLEGMLVNPAGDYTVTDNYSLNAYGEIGLARGTKTLPQPTDVARPGAGATAVANANAAKAVTLDDGASLSYVSGNARNIPLPYLTSGPVRVGDKATFTKPVVVDYQFGTYRFQPTSPVTGTNGQAPATFPTDSRTAKPEPVGGDLKIASFNVLNYFTDTGDSVNRDAADETTPVLDCTSNKDRAGNPITVNGTVTGEPTCDARGAWNDANRLRQQAKIVKAINALGADVLSLEEIENSGKFGHPRDESLNTLVAALNADAGSEVWAAAPSPAYRPTLAEEDAIRTAFIYKSAKVETGRRVADPHRQRSVRQRARAARAGLPSPGRQAQPAVRGDRQPLQVQGLRQRDRRRPG